MPQLVREFIEAACCNVHGRFWNGCAGSRTEFIWPRHTGGSQAGSCCSRDVSGMRCRGNHHAFAWRKIKRLSRSNIKRLRFVVPSHFSTEDWIKCRWLRRSRSVISEILPFDTGANRHRFANLGKLGLTSGQGSRRSPPPTCMTGSSWRRCCHPSRAMCMVTAPSRAAGASVSSSHAAAPRAPCKPPFGAERKRLLGCRRTMLRCKQHVLASRRCSALASAVTVCVGCGGLAWRRLVCRQAHRHCLQSPAQLAPAETHSRMNHSDSTHIALPRNLQGQI